MLVFFNKIGRIVHACSTRWFGSPHRNSSGGYLVVWRLPELIEDEKDSDLFEKEDEEEEEEDLSMNKSWEKKEQLQKQK